MFSKTADKFHDTVMKFIIFLEISCFDVVFHGVLLEINMTLLSLVVLTAKVSKSGNVKNTISMCQKIKERNLFL